MNQTVQKNRLSHVDLLKCLAMVFMLMYHGTLYRYDILAAGDFVTRLRFLFRTVLSTCVPLFFFVNGYLLFGRPLDLKKHTKKLLRFAVVVSVWMLLLLLIMQPVRGEYLTARQVYDMFWSLQMNWNNHLWYMGVLLCIYVFFPLLKKAYDGDKTVFYWFTAGSFLLVFGNVLLNELATVAGWVLNRRTVFDDFNFFHILTPYASGYFGMGLVYFCLGGVALSLQPRVEAVPAKTRNAAAAGLLLLSCILLGVLGYGYSILQKQLWDVVWNGYDTVFTACMVLCLFVLSLNWKRDSVLLRTVSSNTLGIYLIHDVLNRILLPCFHSAVPLRTVWGTLVYALVLLTVCTALCLLIRKIPVLRNLI